MQQFGIEFFLKGLIERAQIGIFLILGTALLMAVLIGFQIWQERTFGKRKPDQK